MDSIPPVEFTKIVGPPFLGVVWNFFFWGIFVCQSYFYFQNFSKDPKTLRGLVLLLFLIDAAESFVVMTTSGWRYSVLAVGDPSVIAVPGPGVVATPVFDAIIANIVHAFYCSRIIALMGPTRGWILATPIIAMTLLQLAAAIVVTQEAAGATLTTFARIDTAAIIWLVGAAVADVLICIIMSVKLFSSRTGFKATDSILSRLIRITVETGMTTATLQILDAIVLCVWKTTTYHMTLSFLLPKIYSNSMLALLNSRSGRDASNAPSLMTGTYDRSDRTGSRLPRLGGRLGDDELGLHSIPRAHPYAQFELDDAIAKADHRSGENNDVAVIPSSSPRGHGQLPVQVEVRTTVTRYEESGTTSDEPQSVPGSVHDAHSSPHGMPYPMRSSIP